jgi:hypothetical protein
MTDADKVVQYNRREWSMVREDTRSNSETTRHLPSTRVTLWAKHTRLSCNRLNANSYAATVFDPFG